MTTTSLTEIIKREMQASDRCWEMAIETSTTDEARAEMERMSEACNERYDEALRASDVEAVRSALEEARLLEQLGGDDQHARRALAALELPEDAALVETMPEHLIASHKEARNFGVYPHNGAVRLVMSLSDFELLMDGEYDHVVRDAEPTDVLEYEVVR